ncbi:envelope-like protein [Cucumis melo var. makuwa]|uniref:Envelope-like protein n=1 Tax=Cucumis melo var. makuwa TaxID=1194695 RepID=A0A5A7SRR3_CUCMM|nr:envelope-like protein [Cucumis melo var. makuwa]
MHDEHTVDSAAEDVETTPGVFESHISERDSDERDDVLLDRLLKKGLSLNVEPSVADVPVTTAHSNESSSSEDILFQHLIILLLQVKKLVNLDVLHQLGHLFDSTLVDNQHSVPDLDPVGDSTGNSGENIADPINENLDTNTDAHGEPIDNCAPRNIEPNVDVPHTETQQPSDFFQGSHVPDIEHDMGPSRNPRMFHIKYVDESAEGFFVHRDLASRIINTLTAEFQALSTSINLLSVRCLEVDSLVRHLKILIPSSSTGAEDEE